MSHISAICSGNVKRGFDDSLSPESYYKDKHIAITIHFKEYKYLFCKLSIYTQANRL